MNNEYEPINSEYDKYIQIQMNHASTDVYLKIYE